MGYGIIGLMIAGWLASMVIYRVAGVGKFDEPATEIVCAAAPPRESARADL
jgi:hypothetical protein